MLQPNKTLHWVLLAALACGPLVGCGDDDEETTASGDETTTGGEDTTGGLDAPAGSVEPDDGSWDGDPDSPPASDTASTDPATPGSDEPAASPWGATRAESCRPPERREMSSSARRQFDAGVRAAASGNVGNARTSFQAALSADSNAFKAAYNLGVLADRQGQANQAMEFYRQALRIQGDYERAVEGVVTIHFRRNQTSEAVSFVEPLARRYPTNLHLQALYAETLVRAERFDQAWDAARAALRCDERFVPALTALVKASIRQGREELAESILDQALAVDGNNAQLHYIKGTLLREEAGRFRDALTAFQRAVQLRPDYTEARMALGVAQLSGGNYREAVTNFEAAANLAPTLVAVHLNLADAYRASKQWTKAKTTFDKALEMEPTLAQAHFNMGLMYMTAGAEFPGLDELQSLIRAREEFTRYRDLMGPRLPRDDQSEAYLTDLNRTIERTQRRIERDAARAARAAEMAARDGASE